MPTRTVRRGVIDETLVFPDAPSAVLRLDHYDADDDRETFGSTPRFCWSPGRRILDIEPGDAQETRYYEIAHDVVAGISGSQLVAVRLANVIAVEPFASPPASR